MFDFLKPKAKPKPFAWSVNLTVSPPEAEGEFRVDDGTFAEANGPRMSFQFVDPPTHRGWGSDLYITAPGYKPYHWRGVLPSGNTEFPAVNLEKAELPKVRVEGRHFVTDGGRWTCNLATCFQIYDRYLRGEEVWPVLEELQSFGFNSIRVFGMDKYIPEQIGRPVFRPQDFGDDYYNKLPEFCALCAEYEIYVYFVVFADTGWIMPDLNQQITHFSRTIDALKQSSNTLGSLGNELEQHENFVDKTKMPRPQGIAFCSGSGGMDGVAPPPHWDFVEFHPRRDYPAGIKDCNVTDHPLYVQGYAVMIDEPDRFGTQGNGNVEQARLSRAAATESAMGWCFHSKNGVYAINFDDPTYEIAYQISNLSIY